MVKKGSGTVNSLIAQMKNLDPPDAAKAKEILEKATQARNVAVAANRKAQRDMDKLTKGFGKVNLNTNISMSSLSGSLPNISKARRSSTGRKARKASTGRKIDKNRNKYSKSRSTVTSLTSAFSGMGGKKSKRRRRTRKRT